MKTLTSVTLVVLILNLLAPSLGQTFILPLDFVIKKSVSTTHRQIISLEAEVIFKDDKSEIKTNETWAIEGDRNLKVSAEGTGPLKQLLTLNTLVNSKTKTQVLGKNKLSVLLPEDFYMNMLSLRSSAKFVEHLREKGIPLKTRLSRAGGYVCLAVGEPSQDEKKYPQIWIDQDEFLIRKIRLPSGSEITFSDYVKVNDFWIARNHEIKWGNNVVTFKVKKIIPKTSLTLQSFDPKTFDLTTDLSVLNHSTLTANTTLIPVIQDFYSRFR